VWLASQANVYNGQTRRSRDLTIPVSHFPLEAAGQDSGRMKKKLGKQKVAGAASKQPSNQAPDLRIFRVCTSFVRILELVETGPTKKNRGWQGRKCEKQQQRKQQRQQRKRKKTRRAQHTFNYSF
jgi:hypothetical protein